MKKKGKKCQTSRKEKRRGPSKDVSKRHDNAVNAVEEGASFPNAKCLCSHDVMGMDLTSLSSKIRTSEPIKCEECRECSVEKRESKLKSKNEKKRKGGNIVDLKSEKRSVWICLECGCFMCGGFGSSPRGHAVRHSKLAHHSLAVFVENPDRFWCFHCKALISYEMLDADGGVTALADVVAAIKEQIDSSKPLDAEDVCFGNGHISGEIKLDGHGGYVARGLVNLGNTCFFNSVLQNLLSMEKLRNCLLNLNITFGPLITSLQKLFSETTHDGKPSNVINPRSLFACLCSKASQFRGYQQHDSHELLRCFLDGLCTEEMSMKKHIDPVRENGDTQKDCTTFVDELFGGQTSSTVCCMECGHTSTVHEPFLDLSLPLPEKKRASKKIQPAFRPEKTRFTSRKSAHSLTNLRRNEATVSGQASSESLSCFTPTCQKAYFSKDNLPLCDVEQVSGNIYNDFGNKSEKSILDLTWVDYLGPQTLDDNNDESSQNNIQSELDSAGQAPPQKCQEYESSRNSTNNVIPNQLQGSEILFLPGNEEPKNAVETTNRQGDDSSIAMRQKDSMEFDGFSGLFDEPEAVDLSAPEPFVSDDNIPKNDENAESCFTDLNNSDSEAVEVDHTDSPVSIGSCLAYFTKPELLLVDEHAWHCENCSRAARNKRLAAPISSTEGEDIYIDAKQLNKSRLEGKSIKLGNHKKGKGKFRNEVSINADKTFASHSDNSHITFAANTMDGASQVNDPDPCRTVLSHSEVASCPNEANSSYGPAKTTASVDTESDSNSFKVRRNATKRILLNKVPPILTIHLKRFGRDAYGRLNKLNGHIVFKDLIDLRPYMDPRLVEGNAFLYRLIGVVEHLGSMKYGHYVAYIKGLKGGCKSDTANPDFVWYYASDNIIRESSLDEVLRSEAYILFYERIHT